jgi:hypothetical protein
MTRNDWVNILVLTGGWFVMLIAAEERVYGERIRDGLYIDNVLPGFIWSVLALGYASVGLLAPPSRFRWCFVPMALLSGCWVVSHRLFLI